MVDRRSAPAVVIGRAPCRLSRLQLSRTQGDDTTDCRLNTVAVIVPLGWVLRWPTGRLSAARPSA